MDELTTYRNKRAQDYIDRKRQEELHEMAFKLRTVALLLIIGLIIAFVVTAISSVVQELPYTISAYEKALINHKQGW